MKIQGTPYANALLGLAIGDAWGYQVEFVSYDKMPKPVPQPIGEWVVSDDTQMTLALQNAIEVAETVGYLNFKHVYGVEETILEHFVKWAESPLNNRAPGATCMGSIDALKTSSAHWSKVAKHSAGCGAVMRLLPTIALGDDEWKGFTALQAVITHNDPMAVASALVLGEVARALFDGSEQTPLEVAMLVVEAMDAEEYPVDKGLRRVLAPVTDNVEEYLYAGVDGGLWKAIHRASDRTYDATRYNTDICVGVGEGWDAATAVALAVLVADGWVTGDLTTKRAMEWAVTSNGDSDSIGAIAGMLIGLTSTNPDFWSNHGINPTFEDVYKKELVK